MSDTTLRIFPEYSNLIGLDYDRVNCWELVRRFYAQVFGVELKSYFEGRTPVRQKTQALIFSSVGDFKRVESNPEFGDIVVIRLYGIESHIGVYLNDETFLHSLAGKGSVVDRLHRWSGMIVGYYRHEGCQ